MNVKGTPLFGNEIKISQYGDDTKIFYADIISVQNAFNTINESECTLDL